LLRACTDLTGLVSPDATPGSRGADGVTPLDVLPAAFELSAVLPGEDGDASLVGFLDASPVDSSIELVAGATFELTEGLPTHKIKRAVDAMGEVGAFGSYVFAASPYGEHVQVYAGAELTPVATIPSQPRARSPP